jgi:hypothetical protein
LATVIAAGLGRTGPVRAGELDQLDTSLKWIPADAAFYSTLLRNREQVEAAAQSKAWAKLNSLPAAQMLRRMIEAQLKEPHPQFAQLLELYRQPENQRLLELLADALSHEVFCYGGSNFNGFADLAGQAIGTVRYGAALSQLTGELTDLDPEKAQAISLLRALSNNLDLIKIPDLVIGFKLTKAQLAENQLKRLETLLNSLAEQNPQLKSRVKRAKIAGCDFLTVTADGSLVPWHLIKFKDFEQRPGEFEALVKKLRDLKLTVSLGIRANYLLLAIGESTAVLSQLSSDRKLISQPALEPLARHAGKRLTSISYVSQSLRAKMGTTKEDIDHWMEVANTYLPQLNLPAELQNQIRKDLAELAKDIKSFIPEVGPALSFAFLTDRGTEGYSYDWGEHRSVAGTMPLTILNQVGGAPLLAVAGRSKYSPENYQLFVKWLKTAHGYFELIAVPMLDAEKKAHYEEVVKIALPLLERLDKATSTMLLPALADGQSAFVLDGKIKSQQWIEHLPPTEKPMPMLEPACVFGVSDAALLRKAFGEYRSVINDLTTKLHEMSADIPDFKIPEPQTRELKSGTLYFYPLPEILGLDKQIAPNAGLSDKFAVLALTHEHSERLLTKTPLKTTGGPLTNLNRPLTGAAYCNCEELINVLLPWVDLGIKVGSGFRQGADENKTESTTLDWFELVKQLPAALEVLKVFRGYSSGTYLEDKALVTHSEIVIRDLD